MANRAMLCYLQLCGKVVGSNEQDSSDHMHSITTNAVRGDNLNVGTYPDPSSSPNEKSGPRVQ